MSDERTCPTCGAEAQTGTYCAMCGNRLEQAASGSTTGAPAPSCFSSPSVGRRSVAGLADHRAAPFVVAALVAAALILLIAGGWILGLIVLVVLIALVALVATEAGTGHGAAPGRRQPRVDDLRDRARFAVDSARSWSNAGRQVVLLRQQLRSLRADRERRVHATGEAAVARDDGAVESLRAEIASIDGEIAGREAEIQHTLAGTRSQIEQGRVAIKPTELLSNREAEPVAAEAGGEDPGTHRQREE